MNPSFSESSGASHPTATDRVSASRGDREPVLIIVIGSRYGITRIIQRLVQLGFAQMHEWSKPQIDPNSGKLMQIMTKYISPE